MTELPWLELITPDNVGPACRLAVRPDQESFVAPVAVSLAEGSLPRVALEPERLAIFFSIAAISVPPSSRPED